MRWQFFNLFYSLKYKRNNKRYKPVLFL